MAMQWIVVDTPRELHVAHASSLLYKARVILDGKVRFFARFVSFFTFFYVFSCFPELIKNILRVWI